MTNFLDCKQKNDLPFVYPIAHINGISFDNLSQLNRNEKIKQSLLNLKYIIDHNEENEIKIIKEVFKLKNESFS